MLNIYHATQSQDQTGKMVMRSSVSSSTSTRAAVLSGTGVGRTCSEHYLMTESDCYPSPGSNTHQQSKQQQQTTLKPHSRSSSKLNTLPLKEQFKQYRLRFIPNTMTMTFLVSVSAWG